MYMTLPDYIVTMVMLLIPLGIGIFYAWKDSKKINREEYLLGGRDMSMLPVALSIFVTFQSAISLIGIPSEVYMYGPMIFGLYVGIGVSYIVGCFIMVPLMFPLQMTSIYEYLEMRYQSRSVRILSTCIGMLQTFLYMIIALLAPGLAVQAAAGLPFWMSVVVVGVIGTLYTAIGGIKSVIWTDAFQTLVVFLGLIVLIITGTFAVGGVEKAWRIAVEGGRTNMMEFSPDPRVRHTWWGAVIGMMFVWLTCLFNQSSLQRLSSMKTIKSANASFLFNFPCSIIYCLLLIIVGLLLYSWFSVIRCDPIKGGIISNPNQMVLVFLLHVLEDYPGLAGLFMSTIFSGALSTLSSGINALAANTVEDIIPGLLRGVSEKNITIFTKVLVFVYGIVIIGVTYLAKSLQGPVTQMASSVFGACGSAVLGMFLVGSTVPWANNYGAIAGGVVSLGFNMWITIGSRMYGGKPTPLPSLPTDNCPSLLNDSWTYSHSTTQAWIKSTSSSNISLTSIEEEQSEYGFFLYEISYTWYSLVGTVVSCVIILIVSKMTNRHSQTKTDAKLILPMLRKFWQLDETPATGDENEYLSLNIRPT